MVRDYGLQRLKQEMIAAGFVAYDREAEDMPTIPRQQWKNVLEKTVGKQSASHQPSDNAVEQSGKTVGKPTTAGQLTTGMQPFNVFARMGAGAMDGGVPVDVPDKPEYAECFMIARNLPEVCCPRDSLKPYFELG